MMSKSLNFEVLFVVVPERLALARSCGDVVGRVVRVSLCNKVCTEV